MANANLIGLIAVVTLSLFVLGAMVLPFFAAMHHITYIVNEQLITGAIGALSGIISCVALKKINENSNQNKDQ